MDIVIAHLDDAEELVQLHTTLSEQHPFVPGIILDMELRREWMKFHLRKDRTYHQIFLAKNKGQIVGNLWIGTMDDTERAHHGGLGIAILKDYLNQGLGTAMLNKAERWAKKKKLRKIRVRVVDQNLQAVLFFLKRGFTFEGLKQEGYAHEGQFYDEYSLVKNL